MIYDCKDLTDPAEYQFAEDQGMPPPEPTPTFIDRGYEQGPGDYILLLVCIDKNNEVTVHRNGTEHFRDETGEDKASWRPEAIARAKILSEAVPENNWYVFALSPYDFYHGEAGKNALEALDSLLNTSLTLASGQLARVPKSVVWTNKDRVRCGKNASGSIEVGDGTGPDHVLDPEEVRKIRMSAEALMATKDR